jgi:hypothetical protein
MAASTRAASKGVCAGWRLYIAKAVPARKAFTRQGTTQKEPAAACANGGRVRTMRGKVASQVQRNLKATPAVEWKSRDED